MKHKLSFVTAYGWILLLGALGIALLCFAPREERASEYENRMLQAMPPVSVDTLTDGSPYSRTAACTNVPRSRRICAETRSVRWKVLGISGFVISNS